MEVATIAVIAAATAFLLNLTAIGVAIFKLGRAVERFERIGVQQASEIGDIKRTLVTLESVVTKSALMAQRLDAQAERLNRIDKLLDDMRRGEGYILPLNPRSVG